MDAGSDLRGRRSLEAAALGEEGPMAGEEGLTKVCSTERKAAAVEEGLTQRRSTQMKTAVGEEAPAVREGMTRLSEMEVLRHLMTRDPRSIAPCNMEDLRGLVEQVRPNPSEEVVRMVVDSFNEDTRKQFIVFQNWVRGEFEEKGYVEVPDEFIREREEARKRKGGQIDLYLPDRHFSTVVGDDGKEQLVFSFKRKEKSEPESNKDNIYLSCSAGLDPEVKAAFRKMSLASEEGPKKGCSTERKAVAGEEGLKKVHSTERKVAAGEEGLKKAHSTERKAVVGDAAPAARVRMTRLSKIEVIRHLSRDPCSIAPYNVDSLRRLVQKEMPNENVPEEVLRAVADSYNDGMRNKFSVFQEWVLTEVQEKGYVEVPEQFIKEREDAEKRQGGRIDLYLPDRYFTTAPCDCGECDGKVMLVFSFPEKEEVVSEPKSNKESLMLSYSAELEPELEAVFSMFS